VKIKFLSGPRQGEISHAPYSQEVQLLASAGLIEIIPYKDFRERLAESSPPPATLPAKVSWGVKTDLNGRVVLCASCSRATCSSFRYDGPDEAFKVPGKLGQPATVFDPRALTFQHCCGATPEKVPVDVLQYYGSTKRGEQRELTKDEVAMHTTAAHVGDSNQHAKPEWQEK
jgi:hypothetical protein